MNFEKDVFISYAHIDDETLSEGLKGWITEFHKSLEVRLSQLLGDHPRIWRDAKLQGNDFFTPEIESQFPKLKIMISIITPRYVKSEWCTKEVDLFFKAADLSGGIAVDNKARIFKVLKTPVEIEEQPAKIRPLLGYEFYRKDAESNRTTEYGLFGKEIEYWNKLNDVAYDIADLIEKLNDKTSNGNKPDITTTLGIQAPSRKIYLAETSSDLKDFRNNLKRELEAHGYQIFPDKHFEPVADVYRKETAAAMNECSLSIHLLGSAYGSIPEGKEQKSIVEIQNEVAAEQSASRGLNRLIWIPELKVTDDERIIKLTEQIKKEDLQKGSDLLHGPIEDFKFAIFDTIRKLDTADKEKKDKEAAAEKARQEAATKSMTTPTAEVKIESEPSTVFLICDERDKDKIPDIRKFLKSQNIYVDTMSFDGTDEEKKIAYDTSLRDCDAVLIFYGQGSESWLKAKIGEVRRKPALPNSRPLKVPMIYKGEPFSQSKTDYDDAPPNFMVADGQTGFKQELFNDFLAKLK